MHKSAATGMTLCLMCAQALTEMLLGGNEAQLDSWFPSVFRVSEHRLRQKFVGDLKVVRKEKEEGGESQT